MMPKEDKVSLVVEGNNSSASKFGLLGEERCQEPTNSNSNFGVKIIQDQLRNMLSSYGMVLDLFLVFHARHFKDCQHAFQMTNKEFPSIRVSEDHDVGKIESLCVFIDIFQLHIPPGVIGHVVKDHHHLFQEVIDLYGRLQLSSNQNFHRSIVLENVVELIEHGFIIFLHELLPSFLLIFDSDRFLSHFRWQLLPFLSFFHLDLVLHDISFIVYFLSFLLILDLIGLLLKGSGELLHTLRTWLYSFCLLFLSHLLLV